MYRIILVVLLALAFPAFADDDSARKLFEVHSRFAAMGSAEAQFKLGEMYEEGRGTVKDLGKAREWYMKAADQGHEEAKNRLTTLGKRVSEDDVKRLEREAEQAKQRAAEERQAALEQQRAEQERQALLQRKRQEEERTQRAEDERKRQQQAQQRQAEEERARQAAQQKRQEEERAKRAAAASASPPPSPPAKVNAAEKDANKDAGQNSFETDPCKGAAARFLSTCH